MITIGICDDEQICREMLLEYCERAKEQLNEKFTYQVFCSSEEVLGYDRTIDILLLDIELDGTDGIETMIKLEEYDNVKNILFVSGYSERVYDSFGSKTRGFVCKPVEQDRFIFEIKRILQTKKADNEIFEIVEKSGTAYVSSSDIILIEVTGKSIRMYTKEREFNIKGSLSEWQSKLKKYNVIQVHKSFLVNLCYVSNIKDVVTLKGVGFEPTVGRKYKDTCRQAYREYMFEKFRERTNGRF